MIQGRIIAWSSSPYDQHRQSAGGPIIPATNKNLTISEANDDRGAEPKHRLPGDQRSRARRGPPHHRQKAGGRFPRYIQPAGAPR